jgi:hypothetical protein
VLERWAPAQAQTRDAYYREFDRQDIALLAQRIVARRAMDRPHCAVRERLCVELRGIQGSAVVPEK